MILGCVYMKKPPEGVCCVTPVCVTQQTQGGAVSRRLVAFSHRAAEEEESGQGRTGK